MKLIDTDKAPKAIGHYSQAVKANGFLFLSGQIAIGAETTDIKTQTQTVLKNIHGILQSEGLDWSALVKVTVFLKEFEKFSEFNSVYAEILGSHKPARSAVEVSRLPKNVALEIEAIAVLPE